MKRSRLKRTDKFGRKRRLRSEYHISVTQLAPTHYMFDLWHKNQHIRTVAELDSVDLQDKDLDVHGRIKPNVVWSTLKTTSTYVKEHYGEEPETPSKFEVFGSEYSKESGW